METLKFFYFSEDPFPLKVVHLLSHPDYPIHDHNFSELVIVLGGSGIHYSEEGEYPIKTGDVFLIKDTTAHGYRDVDSLNLANVLFDYSFLDLVIDDLRRITGFNALFHLEPKIRKMHDFKGHLRLPAKYLYRIKRQLDDLHNNIEGKEPGYQSVCVAKFLELLVYVARNIEDSPLQKYNSPYQLAKIVSYIEENYTEQMTLEQLAKKANMSKRNFLRQFSKVMDLSPIDYLVRYRLHRAEKKLKNTNKSITEIAFDSGFTDSNYFSRKFKEIYTLSPAKYRKRFIGNQ